MSAMHFVGVLKPPESLPHAIELVSSCLALAHSEAAARLRGEFPLVLARVTASDAAFLVAELSAAGLAVTSFDDAFLERPQLHCRRIEQVGADWVFTLKDGTSLKLAPHELGFVCRGLRRQVRTAQTRVVVQTRQDGDPKVETRRDETTNAFHFLWVFTRAGDWLSGDAELMQFRPGPRTLLTTAANLDALADALTRGAGAPRGTRALLNARPMPFHLRGDSEPGQGDSVIDSNQPGLRVLAELLRVAP